MTIETKEFIISEELTRKVEMICRFAYVDYTITNGNVKSIKNTNIAMFKPHIVKIKDIDYLIFDEGDIDCMADESNTTTSNGRMVMRIMTSVSQNEIEKCSERTKLGMAGAIKQGHIPN